MAGSGSRLTGISWCKNGLDGRGRTDGYCVKGDDMPYYWLIGGGSPQSGISGFSARMGPEPKRFPAGSSRCFIFTRHRENQA